MLLWRDSLGVKFIESYEPCVEICCHFNRAMGFFRFVFFKTLYILPQRQKEKIKR